MDFRLKVPPAKQSNRGSTCFNPCSNGLSAQRRKPCFYFTFDHAVSILVLMDFRLKDIGAGEIVDVIMRFQSLF